MSVPRIFDRKAYGLRRARARESFLAEEIGEALAYRLQAVNRRFRNALELNAREDVSALLKPLADDWIRCTLAAPESADVVADEECLPFAAQSFDLIVSPLSLHAVNDLPGALTQIRQALKSDGLFLGALFGGATLNELRTALTEGESETRGGASPRIFPFADVRDLGGLLQRAGFALPVADSDRTVIRYGDFRTLAADLRALGETNVLSERSRSFMRRDALGGAMSSYASRHSDSEGRLTATFEVIYLTGWAPHESQQKPLQPGSAKTRLADVLGTAEHAAGDSATPDRKLREP
jgi:SAM-dependent methyltransferase